MDRLVFPYPWWPRSVEMAEEWVKVSQLAAREGVDAKTVWRWVSKDLVETRRLAKATGVRVRLRTAEELAALTTPLPSSRRPPSR